MSSFRNKHIIEEKKRQYLMNRRIPFMNYKIIPYKKTSFPIKMCICIHCYNIDIFNELMYYVRNFFEFDWQRLKIIVHHVHQDFNKIKLIIERLCNISLENDNIFTFIKGDNIGGDIGGFIRCCEYINDDDIVSIIHTKSDKIWRRQMMNIFTKEGIYTSMNLFQRKKEIGIIGSSFNISQFNRLLNFKNDIKFVKSACEIFNYQYNKNKAFNILFLGGTIFMSRKNLLNFFIKNRTRYYKLLLNYDVLYSKGLKRPIGNDYEHAAERLFGYLCAMNNKKLVGIY